MPGDFVETVRIQNFGCVRDTTLELTRLHALIGPNDSGKSTVLAALWTMARLAQQGEGGLAKDSRVREGTSFAAISKSGRIDYEWGGRWATVKRDPVTEVHEGVNAAIAAPVADPIRGARIVRWDPDAIRRPSDLIPEHQLLLVDEKGEGIPAVYEALLSRDRAAFAEIEDGVRRHFSSVRSLWLPTSADKKKSLGVVLNDGTRVLAGAMSEGLLYWLAFAILPYVDSTAILLIEEPENGLHPARISEVMKALRAVSTQMQVVIATHSPLVINELQPEEVTILTRTAAEGTRATRIDRTTHFKQREKVYALGELWLSFADGNSEEALVPPAKP